MRIWGEREVNEVRKLSGLKTPYLGSLVNVEICLGEVDLESLSRGLLVPNLHLIGLLVAIYSSPFKHGAQGGRVMV